MACSMICISELTMDIDAVPTCEPTTSLRVVVCLILDNIKRSRPVCSTSLQRQRMAASMATQTLLAISLWTSREQRRGRQAYSDIGHSRWRVRLTRLRALSLQPSVAPPAGPSKLNKSHTAADQADDEDMLDGGDSEDQSEDSDDDQIEDDDDEAQEGSTPGRRMTDRQKEKAAEKASKANNRSAKKVSCRSVQV